MHASKAFITGASSGIGEALALELSRRGVEVALAARREDSLRALAARIESSGGRARVYGLDVADLEAVHTTLLHADDAMGGIDLVVANAGVGITRWAGKIDWSACGPLLDVNVVGATATLTALVPRMVERKRGHLVGVSSLAGYRALPTHAVYCATKAYLSTLLDGFYMDLHGTGVAVTDVQPGFVKTPMTDKNDFEMPFMVEAEVAARGIADAIAERRRVYAFPLPTTIAARGLQLLPTTVLTSAVRRARKPKAAR